MKTLMRVFLLASLTVVCGCSTSGSKSTFQPSPAEAQLVELMAQRLELAREVAWIKFQNNAKVRDPKREAALLTSLTMEARTMGISPIMAEDFFEAQIRASRTVQTELIWGWKQGQTLPAIAPKDLQRDIRPKLDRISKALLRELVVLSGTIRDPRLKSYAAQTIRARGFSSNAARQAVEPLWR